MAAVRQDAAVFRQWKRTLAAEMARLTRMLHDRRCFHKDLYLCHFYIARDDTLAVPLEGWRGRVYLIDLHRLAHHPLTWRIWQTKDLAQLLYSSDIVGVDARDRLYFCALIAARDRTGQAAAGCGVSSCSSGGAIATIMHATSKGGNMRNLPGDFPRKNDLDFPPRLGDSPPSRCQTRFARTLPRPKARPRPCDNVSGSVLDRCAETEGDRSSPEGGPTRYEHRFLL